MSILFYAAGYSRQEIDDWKRALGLALPQDRLEIWPDIANDDEVEFALVWGHQPGELARFSKLKAIFSLGAGVEGLLADKAIGENMPIIRLIDPNLANAMAEYMLMRVLYYHRQMHLYQGFQNAAQWRELPYISASDRTIGILGLGMLGRKVAVELGKNGFRVIGWSRTQKSLANVDCFSGDDGFQDVLRQADVLICLLPLTSATEGLLCAKAFEQMPKDACLINAGRGGHVVVEDLIQALDADRLAHATLDVFETEPLPEDHLLWRHPKVTITPHVSALTLATDAPKIIAENIRKFRAGDIPDGLIDRAQEY